MQFLSMKISEMTQVIHDPVLSKKLPTLYITKNKDSYLVLGNTKEKH